MRLALIALAGALAAQEPDALLLKDYHPKSIFKVPETHPQKAKYPAIDMHYHIVRGPSMERAPGSLEARLKAMDAVGIEKTVILTLATGDRFNAVAAEFGKMPGRFQLWCGLDTEHFSAAEVERCARKGAKGVGEIGDKGSGMMGSKGVHPDDPRMDAIWEKCADLKMPVSLHVADPRWAYEKMDNTNDGLMDAFKWRLDNKPGIVDHAGMIDILERTLERHPRTIFVACHLANLDFDLAKLGQLFDKYPNLYADISARWRYFCAIPRVTAAFFEKYSDRIVYGTDAGFQPTMYRSSFRALESSDDHYYENLLPELHWPMYGLGLSDLTLRKIYRNNALRILQR